MSFVLAHRPHIRQGQRPVNFTRVMQYKDEEYEMKIEQGGYTFQLQRPIRNLAVGGVGRGFRDAGLRRIDIALDQGALPLPCGTAAKAKS